MSIQNQINDDIKDAMKKGLKTQLGVLRVIKSELDRESSNKKYSDKVIPDDVTIGILKKLKKNAVEQNNEVEINIIENHLPSMINEGDLYFIIEQIIFDNAYSSMKSMGLIMKEIKANYGATVDGALASKIIKEKLS